MTFGTDPSFFRTASRTGGLSMMWSSFWICRAGSLRTPLLGSNSVSLERSWISSSASAA